MDWVDRLARLGGCAVLTGIVACGRTGVRSPLALTPSARGDSCAAAASQTGRIVVAIAAPTDSGVTAEMRVGLASRVLDQVAAALRPTQCDNRATASYGGQSPAPDTSFDVRQVVERDARDALDLGVDVLVTRDVAVIAYAATRGDLISIPLSWDRAYLLLVPGTISAAAAPPSDSSGITLRSELASDAVPAESRPFASTPWWMARTPCREDSALLSRPEAGSHVVSEGSSGARPAESRAVSPAASPAVTSILYPRGDAVGRALAERVAVLAATGSRSLSALAPGLDPMAHEMHVVGVPADQFTRALAAGTAAAYVVAVPSRMAPSCRDERLLADAVPWLPLPADGRTGDIVPLIETRARAIVSRNAVAWIGAGGDSASLAQMRGHGP